MDMANTSITAFYDDPYHPLGVVAETRYRKYTRIPKPQDNSSWDALFVEQQADALV